MNKYFEEIENNIDNVLQVLKNDEALCNMLVDMIKNKCNTVDWREEQSFTALPEFMIDFYDETTLSDDWKKLNDFEKLIKLNTDLETYFKQ